MSSTYDNLVSEYDCEFISSSSSPELNDSHPNGHCLVVTMESRGATTVLSGWLPCVAFGAAGGGFEVSSSTSTSSPGRIVTEAAAAAYHLRTPSAARSLGALRSNVVDLVALEAHRRSSSHCTLHGYAKSEPHQMWDVIVFNFVRKQCNCSCSI